MPHVDPDVLALLALGEPVASDEENRHIAECAVCDSALNDLLTTAAVGRVSQNAGPMLTPPSRVWDGIAGELGLERGIRPRVTEHAADGHGADGHGADGHGAAGIRDAPAAPAGASAPVELASRRNLRRRVVGGLLLAAAATAVVALGIATLQAALSPPPATVLAEAELDAFPDWPEARGAAVLQERPDGGREVVVTLDADVGDDSFREVWLIRDDASDLVSLGVLEGSAGTFSVPAGIDVADFSLVDVSDEPRDGDPTHSGDSIVRGPLT